MATESDFLGPSNEGRKLGQEDLLTQSAGAKFTELANIVICSQDWSLKWIANISQSSISNLWCNVNFGPAEVDIIKFCVQLRFIFICADFFATDTQIFPDFFQ